MPKFKGLKGVIVLFVLAALIVGYYYYLSNRDAKGTEETPAVITAAQQVLQRNLTFNYPQTPKEVVKYFSEITQCYYNETFDDKNQKDLIALADQMLLLYDDELVSYKTYEDYILDLKSDIAFYNTNGYTISSFSPSASTDVVYFTQDGFEWSRLWCLYTIKAGKSYKTITEVFILRKDEKGHWRIYGWDKVKDE